MGRHSGNGPISRPEGLKVVSFGLSYVLLGWKNNYEYDQIQVRWGQAGTWTIQFELPGDSTRGLCGPVEPDARYAFAVQGQEVGLLGQTSSGWTHIEWQAHEVTIGSNFPSR